MSKHKVDLDIAGTITDKKPTEPGWTSIGECCGPDGCREYWLKDDPPDKRDRISGTVEIPDD